MHDEGQGVVTGLKAVILRQYCAPRGGRCDGGVCEAVELKVVSYGPRGEAGQLNAVSWIRSEDEGGERVKTLRAHLPHHWMENAAPSKEVT